MVRQVLDGAFSGNDSLDIESEHGEHGEASVLELLDLELSESVWVVSQAQGVEVLASRVEGVQALEGGEGVTSVGAEGLGLSHQDDLDGDGGDDGLGMDQAVLAQVVEATLLEDLGTGLEPDGLGGSGLVQLGDDTAQSSQEGPPVFKVAINVEGMKGQTIRHMSTETTEADSNQIFFNQPGVDDLNGSVPLEGLGVSRETSSVLRGAKM